MSPEERCARVKSVWRQCDAVCFDVDSTVITEEGLDELAAFLNKGAEVAALTNQAMGGSMTFREALEKRLDILKPGQSDVESFVGQGRLKITSGISELVHALRKQNADIYLVSGGFKRLIQPIADSLDIPTENIYANELYFNDDGSFKGFNKDQPTSASGGKTRVAELLKSTRGYKNLVFIGDGMTDLEACPPADAFIGFGGNVVRDKVKERAEWYVMDIKELLNELQQGRTL